MSLSEKFTSLEVDSRKEFNQKPTGKIWVDPNFVHLRNLKKDLQTRATVHVIKRQKSAAQAQRSQNGRSCNVPSQCLTFFGFGHIELRGLIKGTKFWVTQQKSLWSYD